MTIKKRFLENPVPQHLRDNTSERMKGNTYAQGQTHNRGRIHTEEQNKNHSERMKGELHPFFGKSRPEMSSYLNKTMMITNIYTNEGKRILKDDPVPNNFRKGWPSKYLWIATNIETNEIFKGTYEEICKKLNTSKTSIQNASKTSRLINGYRITRILI